MTGFDERIRAARPPSPPLPDDFAGRVMDEIARRRLTVRPAPLSWAARWLPRAAALVVLAAGAVLAGAAMYAVRMNGALELLYFGWRFADGFVAALPYELILPPLLLAAFAAWLLRRGRVLRVPVAWAVLLSYGLTGAGGLTLAGSGVSESLHAQVLEEAPPLPGLAWYYRERATYRRPHPAFRMGRVVRLRGREAVLETPGGEAVTAVLPPPLAGRVQAGDHLRLRGRAAAGGRFEAAGAQLCNPRRVAPYFRHHAMMRHGRGPMGPEMAPGMHRGMAPGAGRSMHRGMDPGMGPMGPPATR